jgi:uncharacterized protein (DUF1330 family)
MTAYVVLMRERTRDAVEFDAYMAKIPSTRANHAVTRLAVFGKLTVLEGPQFEGAVILSFPTAEEALAWYNSPAYQDALMNRVKGSDHRVFIIDGVAGHST